LATGYRAAITELELRRALQQAMDDYPTSPIKMRWDLSPEPFTALGTDARMIATLVPNKPQPDWVYEQGVNLSLNTDLQRTIPTTKGAAFALERNQIEFGTRDHFEPVMVDDSGHLLEGVMSNFGAILEGRLYTRSRKVLPGITIRTLLQLAEQIGLEVVNEPIHRDDLGRIEEAFLCSAVRGLVSARSIDGVTIGSGKPGPWVQRLASAYALHAESNAKRLWPV
jgi:branched-chain amino acid aminotransferase